jgi:hypothetical protein
MRGYGEVKLIHAYTGEVADHRVNGNVILDQAIRGLAGRASTASEPAVSWFGFRSLQTQNWRLRVSNGYSHMADDSSITKLDGQDLWTSDALTWSLGPTSASTIIEIPADQANFGSGGITECGLYTSGLWNRLMFKSPAALPNGSYTYYIQGQIGTQRYSALSAGSTQVMSGPANGAIILKWVRTHPAAVDRHNVYREITGDPATRKLIGTTSNYFFIDPGIGYGFDALPSQSLFSPTTPAISAPLITLIEPSFAQQPLAVKKTAEYALRIILTITFT